MVRGSGHRKRSAARALEGGFARSARVGIAALLLVALVGPLTPAPAFTTTTITIDGDFSDWIGVRADPDNVAVDTQIPDDPDYPSQPDRDIYYTNVTYDDDYLYFAWRRTAGGTKAITFGAYLDLDNDGLLQDTDRVVLWSVSTGSPYDSQGRILHYHQAQDGRGGSLLYPDGDPMGGDGDTPDGWARRQDGEDTPSETMDAYLSTGDGIECEARVAWSDLGLSAGDPITMHFSSGNGETWGTPYKPSNTWKWIGSPPQYLEENRGQVEDNIGPPLTTGARVVSIDPDNWTGASAGTTVTYTHTLSNLGNLDDSFSLESTSSQGWTTRLLDSSGSVITTLALAAGETTSVVIEVVVPTGVSDGTADVTTVRATSETDSSVTDAATDTTTIGSVTVVPDQTGSMAPGGTITYTHTVTNNMATTQTLDLTGTSSQGWTTGVYDESGTTTRTAVTLASGESTTVVVTIAVPAGAANGTQDTTTLRAAVQGDPSTYGEATDITTVLPAIQIEPDNEASGGAGTYVSYRHTITNSWSATRTVSLSEVSSEGWDVTFYDTDGVTEITSVDVGPFGGTHDIWARVAVPSTASAGDEDTTTVTATAGSDTDTATDHTIVRQLAIYDSAGYADESYSYVLGETAYGRGTGLSAGSTVYFEWRDPDNNLIRTSPNRTVDTQGMAFDDYTTTATDPTGTWTLLMYSSGGTLLESVDFDVTFDAEITQLSATDAATVGASTSVDSSVVNNGAVAITDSTITYYIWWDSDGDGVFDVGDVYMDESGEPVTYDGSQTPVSHETTGVAVAASGGTWSEDPPWTMSNTHFPNQGTYNVTATWESSTGVLIDEKITQFYSIPAMGWPLFLLALVGGTAFLWRRGYGRELADRLNGRFEEAAA